MFSGEQYSRVEGKFLVPNYTLRDIEATIAVIPVFSIFLFTPGYSFGMATNLLEFRDRSSIEKILLSLPFSIVVSTILTNLIGRYLSANVVLWIFLVLAAGVFLYCTRRVLLLERSGIAWLHTEIKITIALAILWALIVAVSLVDIGISGKLYVSTALWDHAVRIAFVHSVLRSGVPPVNPFSYMGHAPIARYYYYWYVLCSYPVRLTNISPRYVLYGSSVWAGFSLAAMVPIYLKNFSAVSGNLRRKSLLGIALLSVTGLDILPTVYEFLRAKTVYPDMEWWDPVQVTSWQDALLWVPHHVAAVIACFIGFLALWSVRRGRGGNPSSAGAKAIAAIFSAMAFAAAAGLSVYVTFTFAIFLVLWALRLLYKWKLSDFLLYLVSGCLTVFISIPYLHNLLPKVAPAGASSTTAAAGVFALGLRVLPAFLSTPHFLLIRGFSHPRVLEPFGVVIVYILEFGFFAIVGLSRLRQDLRRSSRLRDVEIASWYLVAVSMFVITFIKSTVISNNDLAYRSAMITQFVLLLWGAEYLDYWIYSDIPNNWKRFSFRNAAIVGTLLLGFIGTVYSLAILRSYAILEDRGMIPHPENWLPLPPDVGEDLFSIRTAYERLNQALPRDSIVQYNPMTADSLPLLMYDKFQAVDAFPDCGTEFGGDVNLCPPVQGAISNLFNKPGNYNLHAICNALSIDVLVARKSDPAWGERTSWVWDNQPIVDNRYIRAFRCR